jgi:hypothetical protein
MKITINGVEYTLKFGYGCLRCLSTLWGLPSVNHVIEKVDAENEAGRSLEACIDLVRASVSASGSNDPGTDDVGDYLMQNPEKMTEIIELLVASLPAAPANETGKQKAQRVK